MPSGRFSSWTGRTTKPRIVQALEAAWSGFSGDFQAEAVGAEIDCRPESLRRGGAAACVVGHEKVGCFEVLLVWGLSQHSTGLREAEWPAAVWG